MARAIITANPERRPALEPLYFRHPDTDACVEIFWADHMLAQSFGVRGLGWFHWTCEYGGLPGPVAGPFVSAFAACRDALGGSNRPAFGLRRLCKS
jgi:hypothetical protein